MNMYATISKITIKDSAALYSVNGNYSKNYNFFVTIDMKKKKLLFWKEEKSKKAFLKINLTEETPTILESQIPHDFVYNIMIKAKRVILDCTFYDNLSFFK